MRNVFFKYVFLFFKFCLTLDSKHLKFNFTKSVLYYVSRFYIASHSNKLKSLIWTDMDWLKFLVYYLFLKQSVQCKKLYFDNQSTLWKKIWIFLHKNRVCLSWSVCTMQQYGITYCIFGPETSFNRLGFMRRSRLFLGQCAAPTKMFSNSCLFSVWCSL